MQLPREIVVEKSGEFRGIQHTKTVLDNPEPSPEPFPSLRFREGAETIPSWEYPHSSYAGEAPDTLLSQLREGEEIVQALK